MEGILEQIISRPWHSFSEKAMLFLPNIFTALFVLLIGFIASWLTRLILKRLFTVIRLDALSGRTGLTAILAKGGLHEPFSCILARLASGLVLFVFFLASLNSLDFTAIQGLVEKFFLYLPNIFIAAAILILGYMIGNFIGRAVLIAAVNAGVKISGLISKGVTYLIYLLGVTMAIEHLGIGSETVLISFAIIFSGIVLALAIAFGIGGKDVAREYLEKRFRENPDEDDVHHL